MSSKLGVKDRSKKRISFQVADETATRSAFGEVRKALGFKILETRTRFPDYILERDGTEIRAEAEYKASDFVRHKHDPNGCDLILCWIDDLPSGFPVKRLALIDYVQERPRFDALPAEEIAEIPRMREQLEKVFVVVNAVDDIAKDVHWMFQGDRRVASSATEMSLDNMRRMLDEEARHPFESVILTADRDWEYGSHVRLAVDLAAMSLTVEAILYPEVVKNLSAAKVKSLLKRSNEVGMYAARYSLVGSRSPYEPELDDLGSLSSLAEEKKVNTVSLSKSYKLGELLYGDPHDVVRRLHEDLDGLLSLLEEEKLYVPRQKA